MHNTEPEQSQKSGLPRTFSFSETRDAGIALVEAIYGRGDENTAQNFASIVAQYACMNNTGKHLRALLAVSEAICNAAEVFACDPSG